MLTCLLVDEGHAAGGAGVQLLEERLRHVAVLWRLLKVRALQHHLHIAKKRGVKGTVSGNFCAINFFLETNL